MRLFSDIRMALIPNASEPASHKIDWIDIDTDSSLIKISALQLPKGVIESLARDLTLICLEQDLQPVLTLEPCNRCTRRPHDTQAPP